MSVEFFNFERMSLLFNCIENIEVILIKSFGNRKARFNEKLKILILKGKV